MSYKLKNRPGGCLTSLLFLPLTFVLAIFGLIKDVGKGK